MPLDGHRKADGRNSRRPHHSLGLVSCQDPCPLCPLSCSPSSQLPISFCLSLPSSLPFPPSFFFPSSIAFSALTHPRTQSLKSPESCSPYTSRAPPAPFFLPDAQGCFSGFGESMTTYSELCDSPAPASPGRGVSSCLPGSPPSVLSPGQSQARSPREDITEVLGLCHSPGLRR